MGLYKKIVLHDHLVYFDTVLQTHVNITVIRFINNY